MAPEGYRAVGRPDWRDDSLGGRARVALWLLDQVGEGGVFTKAMLRDSFPGVEQIDRRMRDLRSAGWDIRTARQDASLSPRELRFVAAGAEVWRPGAQSPARMSAKERAAILRRDGYCCVDCGISAGERHPGGGGRAQIAVTPRPRPGDDATNTGMDGYVTRCDLCRAGGTEGPDRGSLLSRALALPEHDRSMLREWLSRGERGCREVGLVWSDYRRLAPLERRRFRDEMSQVTESPKRR